ncbi:hypothetical protein CM19_04010 [Candidatus Acidianus copahuensis]|uniref:Uncharacterized protein n=2 Tax=Candidatus Acidianus copahuensis TaxID=1160895 RepID=A0A031LSB7_9CREN|nr:hypothetical protein CM19_04010 [Candidatus Acidianus copahuensis]
MHIDVQCKESRNVNLDFKPIVLRKFDRRDDCLVVSVSELLRTSKRVTSTLDLTSETAEDSILSEFNLKRPSNSICLNIANIKLCGRPDFQIETGKEIIYGEIKTSKKYSIWSFNWLKHKGKPVIVDDKIQDIFLTGIIQSSLYSLLDDLSNNRGKETLHSSFIFGSKVESKAYYFSLKAGLANKTVLNSFVESRVRKIVTSRSVSFPTI